MQKMVTLHPTWRTVIKANSTRKQILNVMADKLSFKDVEQLIPGLSRHRFHFVRLLRLQHGEEAPLLQMPVAVRGRVDPVRLEHFIDFLTSEHIIQDLPFGRRKLKRSKVCVLMQRTKNFPVCFDLSESLSTYQTTIFMLNSP